MKSISIEQYLEIEAGLQCLKTLATYAFDFAAGKNNDLMLAFSEDPGSFDDCMQFGLAAMLDVLELLKPTSGTYDKQSGVEKDNGT